MDMNMEQACYEVGVACVPLARILGSCPEVEPRSLVGSCPQEVVFLEPLMWKVGEASGRMGGHALWDFWASWCLKSCPHLFPLTSTLLSCRLCPPLVLLSLNGSS